MFGRKNHLFIGDLLESPKVDSQIDFGARFCGPMRAHAAEQQNVTFTRPDVLGPIYAMYNGIHHSTAHANGKPLSSYRQNFNLSPLDWSLMQQSIETNQSAPLVSSPIPIATRQPTSSLLSLSPYSATGSALDGDSDSTPNDHGGATSLEVALAALNEDDLVASAFHRPDTWNTFVADRSNAQLCSLPSIGTLDSTSVSNNSSNSVGTHFSDFSDRNNSFSSPPAHQQPINLIDLESNHYAAYSNATQPQAPPQSYRSVVAPSAGNALNETLTTDWISKLPFATAPIDARSINHTFRAPIQSNPDAVRPSVNNLLPLNAMPPNPHQSNKWFNQNNSPPFNPNLLPTEALQLALQSNAAQTAFSLGSSVDILNLLRNLILLQEAAVQVNTDHAANASKSSRANRDNSIVVESVERQVRNRRNAACNSQPNRVWVGDFNIQMPKNTGYSTKVFLGGVPWDISDAGLVEAFAAFGNVRVQWPGRDVRCAPGSSSQKAGYVYLVFENERQVRNLLSNCTCDFSRGNMRWLYKISSKRMRSKDVQVIPWSLSHSQHMSKPDQHLDPAKTVFVGALHGMTTAESLARVMNKLFQNVVYVSLDTDKHKYPLGSGRVTFSCAQSYMRAIKTGFVKIYSNLFEKTVSYRLFACSHPNHFIHDH
jgi:RNA recognition motif-containing protein